mmetsp:Transcript_76159/g.240840  ORF Transcript_76159/g.240840 Transcript_76159/m.240840 type:complete len:211 (-) Transcript_76159:833-1465(-)
MKPRHGTSGERIAAGPLRQSALSSHAAEPAMPPDLLCHCIWLSASARASTSRNSRVVPTMHAWRQASSCSCSPMAAWDSMIFLRELKPRLKCPNSGMGSPPSEVIVTQKQRVAARARPVSRASSSAPRASWRCFAMASWPGPSTRWAQLGSTLERALQAPCASTAEWLLEASRAASQVKSSFMCGCRASGDSALTCSRSNRQRVTSMTGS